jgi:hypothetical protein
VLRARVQRARDGSAGHAFLHVSSGADGLRRAVPPGPFVAGSYAELVLTYSAGTFGIDDTGMMKISWRTTSDMAKPQFRDPAGPNYTTVEASNGAKLEYWYDRLNTRPWVNTGLIRVGRGFLREHDTLMIRFGPDRPRSRFGELLSAVTSDFRIRDCSELDVEV